MTEQAVKPEQADLAGSWSSAAITHRGKVRKVNEDDFIQRADIGVWAVADGMGGHHAGDVAARMAMDALAELQPAPRLAACLNNVDLALETANLEMVRQGAATKRGIMGTTIVLLVIDACGLGAFMWAGDSRLYRQRQGRLEQLTTDHSQVENYVRQGLITRAQAAVHPERNIVTRALGGGPEEVLEADLIEIAAGDRFLLCSDGLIRHLSDDEIAQFLARDDPTTACTELLDCTLERGSVDNTTVLIVDVAARP